MPFEEVIELRAAAVVELGQLAGLHRLVKVFGQEAIPVFESSQLPFDPMDLVDALLKVYSFLSLMKTSLGCIMQPRVV